ncbi:MAG: phosphoribosyltransferase [Alphaproteobacteria bacterium]
MFTDRTAAGQQLARALERLREAAPVIYAVPRGGLPVAAEVAAYLKAPLDIVLVRKIGAPWQPELAIGAVVDGHKPITVLHDDVIRQLSVSQDYIKKAENEALAEIERRRQRYLQDQPSLPAAGRTAIVVDDGIATGATVEAVLRALRQQNPRSLVLAVPVAPSDALERLKPMLDETVCIQMPGSFGSVGAHYLEFPQTSDDEVARILAAANRREDG